MSKNFFGLVLAAVMCVSVVQAQQPASQPAQTPQQPAPQPPAQNPPAQAPPAGQQPAPSAQDQEDLGTPLKLGVNEVNLIFTVTDKHGHYIPNLKQSDFALLDDQKAPEKITSFRQQINLPLRVGIVIDTSTSIRSRFQFEKQSAT
jgi:Ca-activated chloride channel family protein